MNKRFGAAIAAGIMTIALGAGALRPAPALADGAASTRNIILGAAALVAGIAIESNVAHKNAVANTVEGYLPNGATVYEDGNVVLPNGESYYPGNYGESIDCNGEQCSISSSNGYQSNGYQSNAYQSNGYQSNGFNYNNGHGDRYGRRRF